MAVVELGLVVSSWLVFVLGESSLPVSKRGASVLSAQDANPIVGKWTGRTRLIIRQATFVSYCFHGDGTATLVLRSRRLGRDSELNNWDEEILRGKWKPVPDGVTVVFKDPLLPWRIDHMWDQLSKYPVQIFFGLLTHPIEFIAGVREVFNSEIYRHRLQLRDSNLLSIDDSELEGGVLHRDTTND